MKVICLHSTGLSGRQWNSLRALLPNIEVHTPDLLGYGNNEWKGPENYNLDTELAPLEELMSEPCVLIGHSCGGFLALKLAARHPERVERLVVFDPIAWGVLRSADSPLLQKFRETELEGRERQAEDWLPHFVKDWGGPGGWESASDSTKTYMREREEKIRTEVATLTADRTPHTEYLRVECPTLLMGGRESPELVQEVVRLLSETLPNATTVWLDCGHMGPILLPNEFNGHVLGFMKERRVEERDRAFHEPDDGPTESTD